MNRLLDFTEKHILPAFAEEEQQPVKILRRNESQEAYEFRTQMKKEQNTHSLALKKAREDVVLYEKRLRDAIKRGAPKCEKEGLASALNSAKTKENQENRHFNNAVNTQRRMEELRSNNSYLKSKEQSLELEVKSRLAMGDPIERMKKIEVYSEMAIGLREMDRNVRLKASSLERELDEQEEQDAIQEVERTRGAVEDTLRQYEDEYTQESLSALPTVRSTGMGVALPKSTELLMAGLDEEGETEGAEVDPTDRMLRERMQALMS